MDAHQMTPFIVDLFRSFLTASPVGFLPFLRSLPRRDVLGILLRDGKNKKSRSSTKSRNQIPWTSHDRPSRDDGHWDQFGISEKRHVLSGVSDLNVLPTDGMDISSPLGSRKIFVRVVGFCGDNLSMHAIGGFTCSSSCGRVCRYCLTRSSELGEVKSERHHIVRDAKTHIVQLEAIQVNPCLASPYGVPEKSPLLELESFDVMRQLPPDVMHDIFEGTFAVIMHYTLRGLVEDNVLTAGGILRADSFPYGTNDNKNRPAKIGASFLSDSKSMRDSASQKCCLFRLMPLIFGPIVPDVNHKWELFLIFRELADIILAEKMTSECPQYLEDKIEDCFMTFLAKYPNARVPPKLHYMVHYPRVTTELGPLRQYWCLRFEAKHQFLQESCR
ncbi:uncharacterized protein LOC135384421 [Ornithodoros turicata]|uniref:uncharacterized protein LOC135384421 n=1 Tax=Ornithodoros turicata TaxID=34597 RepID=UPI003139658F